MADIAIADNFLPDELYIECYNYATTLFTSGDMVFTTNRIWMDTIVQDSNPILVHHIDNTHSLCKRLTTCIADRLELSNINFHGILFYFYTPGSHIPWHNDNDYTGGITIYLNKEWNIDWGGGLIYKSLDSNMINGGVYPKQNRAIHIQNNIEHSVFPTVKCCPVRMSIQCFYNNADIIT
mgnify:FL=1